MTGGANGTGGEASRGGLFDGSAGANLAPRFLKALAAILAISLVLEVGLFNVKHWETLGNAGTAVELAESTDGSQTVYEARIDNADVNSLELDIFYTGATAFDVTISLSDSGNSAAEYDLPTVTYYSGGQKYLMIDAYGVVKSLRIVVEQPSWGEISISGVSLNPQIPFSFEGKRFALVFVLLLVFWLMRPHSALWKMRASERAALPRAACLGALAVAIFFGAISFAGATDDGNVSWYNTFAYNEYTQLAHSLAKGQLYLDEQPPSWLEDLSDQSAGADRLLGESNVYDSSLREQLAIESGEWCKDDAAYYDGHYYVYFGVVPVVLLYLPFYLVTGADLSDAFAVMFAVMLFVVFAWLLLRELCAGWFKRASVAAFALAYATVLCASEIVFSLARPQLYNEPVAFALMFAALGLWLLLRGWRSQRTGCSCALMFFGALSLACIAGCRPQLLLVAAVIPLMVIKLWRSGDRLPKTACLCVPVLIVGALIMWYNFARFGSPFDFGANYNLAGNDMTLRDFSLVRAVEGIVFYLFATPHVTTAFPFFQAFFIEPSYMSINMSEPIVMGVFIQCPLLFATLYYLVANRKDARRVCWASIAWLTLSGAVIAVFDANAAGLLGRYSQDFGVFFGLAAALVLLDVDARGALAGFARNLVCLLSAAMIMFTITSRLSLMTPDSVPSGPRETTAMARDAQPLFEFWR